MFIERLVLILFLNPIGVKCWLHDEPVWLQARSHVIPISGIAIFRETAWL